MRSGCIIICIFILMCFLAVCVLTPDRSRDEMRAEELMAQVQMGMSSDELLELIGEPSSIIRWSDHASVEIPLDVREALRKSFPSGRTPVYGYDYRYYFGVWYLAVRLDAQERVIYTYVGRMS